MLQKEFRCCADARDYITFIVVNNKINVYISVNGVRRKTIFSFNVFQKIVNGTIETLENINMLDENIEHIVHNNNKEKMIIRIRPIHNNSVILLPHATGGVGVCFDEEMLKELKLYFIELKKIIDGKNVEMVQIFETKCIEEPNDELEICKYNETLGVTFSSDYIYSVRLSKESALKLAEKILELKLTSC